MADEYKSLATVLLDALDQAQTGKGHERHAQGDTPFERQPICEIARMVGTGYLTGQAMKKAQEAMRLPNDRAQAELLGAINYLAAAVLVLREQAAAAEPGSPKRRHMADKGEPWKVGHVTSEGYDAGREVARKVASQSPHMGFPDLSPLVEMEEDARLERMGLSPDDAQVAAWPRRAKAQEDRG